jgi:hypothetical protein
MDTYSTLQYSGRGRGRPANHPHPLNTSSHNTAARRPPHPSYTQQHTTTLHNSNRVHKTTNVPVVFMARYVIVLRGATSLRGALFWAQMALASLVPFQGPKKSRFSGPTPSNAPRNDVPLLKTINVPRHKNNRYISYFMISTQKSIPTNIYQNTKNSPYLRMRGV